MRITFLGTNGWYSTQAGETICTLVEMKNCYVILDAGEGFRNLDKYIKKDLPVYLLLSHLHLDHVYGLHIIPRMKFKNRLTVIVPQEKKQDLMRFADSPYMGPLKKIVPKIISVKTGKIENLPFSLECQKLRHQDGGFGYRLESEGKSITYCSDTGYCEEAIKLAEKSNALIHECTLAPGFKDGGWGHASPEDAAKVAKKAGVKNLFLTHFMDDFYPTIASRKKAEKAAQKIFKNSTSAFDGMKIVI